MWGADGQGARPEFVDVPVDGAGGSWCRVWVRRLVCPVLGCLRQAFGARALGLVECYQCRVPRLARQLGLVVHELAAWVGVPACPVPEDAASLVWWLCACSRAC